MVLKNITLETKSGDVITASVSFYIESFNEEEAVGHIEEISCKEYDDLELEDLTSESLAELQYSVDELASENAYENWYESKTADAYDQWKDNKYE